MKSYWLDTKKENFNSLKKDTETDICIIGGGITGLSIAYYLNQYKINNVVLEKDCICSRTSGHSTAKITSQHGNIDCDFEKQSAYVFTQKIDEIQKIKDEVYAVNSFGGNANYVEAHNINIPLKALCAIEFPNQAQFNPYKYVSSLAHICTNRHTKIYEHSKVIDVVREGRYYILQLENNITVKAKYVVIATKYPFINFPRLLLFKDVSIHK